MSKYQVDSLFEAEQSAQTTCTHIVRVAFESGADAEFDYLVPDDIWPIAVGQRVEVPFGRKNKLQVGFCAEADIPFEESFTAR
ncbi:MAG: primosomal protein N' family DNA-binding protein, partial [Planctomycetota bacterium]